MQKRDNLFQVQTLRSAKLEDLFSNDSSLGFNLKFINHCRQNMQTFCCNPFSFVVIHNSPCGGSSSVGRAPGCGPGGRGFNPRLSPHSKQLKILQKTGFALC
jgi:hypothetical protein